jgi:CRISPR-associated protein Csd1
MILQALARYYERRAKDADTALAPEGFQLQEVPFIIVVSSQGELVQIEDTRQGEGKRRRARQFEVPAGVKRASGVAADLLWGSPEYIFGLETAKIRAKLAAKNKQKEKSRLENQRLAFQRKLSEITVYDEGIVAVRQFLANTPLQKLIESPHWSEIVDSSPNMTFRLNSDTVPICQRPAVVEFLSSRRQSTAQTDGICLVSGQSSKVQRLHTAIKGVWGAQSSGANVVSFNQRAFESYGKVERQGANAPVGETAAFAYTTALNSLLGKDSKQRVQVGDASTVFWADEHCDLESSFQSFWSETPKDDPDRCVAAVKALYESVATGRNAKQTESTQFFVLGLAPNASRISIRFWLHGGVSEFARRLVQHFEDLAIVHSPFDKPHLPLFRLLLSIAALGKIENVPPNLAGDTIRAILTGLPYPNTLLQACVRRIRADRSIPYPRAALLKACINRDSRYRNRNNLEELKVALDIDNTHPGYRLGRLFAVLEKIQEEASPGINATIRDRFYGAASATPVTVFPNLLKLSKHHLAKIEHPGRVIGFERWISEILNKLQEFPPLLPMDQQGRFAIGYYHQRQAFFTKNTESEKRA